MKDARSVALGVTALVATLGFNVGLTPAPSATADSASHVSGAHFVKSVDTEKFPWLDTKLSAEKRADLLVAAMNNDQLIRRLHGATGLTGGTTPMDINVIGYLPSIPELRIPAIWMTDGPAGLRNGDPATQMPAPISQAAAFSPDNAYKYGKTIGEDSIERGQDMLFSPGLNLARNPEAGRTFEYFGEDPYLAGTTAAAHVNGLQSTGMMATVKHWVANNQETNRNLNSSNVDPRTLREIYEKPFEIAVHDSKPAAVMCAYNKVNNDPACGNADTLIHDLRQRIGFKGMVVSDYPATWSTTDLRDGLNIELPGKLFTSKEKVEKSIAAKEMSWDDVRARVREVLVQMFTFGLFDKPWDEKNNDRVRDIKPVDPKRGHAVARTAAENGAVLLKNDGILPLASTGEAAPKRVLVIGKAAKKTMNGGGSSDVSKPIAPDHTLAEITARLPKATVIHKSEWDPTGIAQEAPKADVVIIVAAKKITELFDTNLDMPLEISNAINNAASKNPRTVVVTQIGGPTLMPWLDKVPGVLNVWYPGEAGGAATTRLLFGDVNPSGRLPQTFPARKDQKPAKLPEQFPGGAAGFQAEYTEGVFMGYRWYQQANEKPLFPFGFGLSYTTFDYSNVAVSRSSGTAKDSVSVSVTVRNVGSVAGDVTPQVYVKKPGTKSVPTPARELAAFQRVHLNPGQSQKVTMTVKARELSIFDVKTDAFVARAGSYTFEVGDNVDDIRGSAKYTVR